MSKIEKEKGLCVPNEEPEPVDFLVTAVQQAAHTIYKIEHLQHVSSNDRDRDRERQTDRQKDRQRERERVG